MKLKNLAEVIAANPGCFAVVDNDSWVLYKANPNKAPEEGDKYDQWLADNFLADEGDVKPLGDGGYGSGCCYGGDILQALAKIVGMHIESV